MSKELVIEAAVDNLPQVLAYVDSHLEEVGCSPADQIKIDLAVEEIFVNIANYAYYPEKGNASIQVKVIGDPMTVVIIFMDNGIPYDPLQNTDPDVSLPAGERKIGGLGIFLTKKTMDDVIYEYRDGRNILQLWKKVKTMMP